MMAGNEDSNRIAADTKKRIYGKDYYSRIGRLGGKKPRVRSYSSDHDLAVRSGRKGGQISRKPPRKVI